MKADSRLNFKHRISKLNLTGGIYQPNLKMKFGCIELCRACG
ncbi:hypothetical protein [Campylobacter gracilis]|uniref:Uncharacterized protein n=1 Tax=Campylobacter gracilis RM3268 TaxID=553220 RepID=C8PF61_9BACT|nr:hypothetical protein [Campylobacter gracilis]EEV18689.1 hypothetical protein CAMGR0001_2702 [Campylobacter gracilis RM3268]